MFELYKKNNNKNPKATKANKGKLMSLSKCASCDSKKLRFIKIQEASGLKTPLSKISLLGDILF